MKVVWRKYLFDKLLHQFGTIFIIASLMALVMEALLICLRLYFNTDEGCMAEIFVW